MSRLYLKAYSDTCESGKTMSGNQRQTLEVFYGSKEKSKRAIKIYISYPNGAETPLVQIATIEGIINLDIKGELV